MNIKHIIKIVWLCTVFCIGCKEDIPPSALPEEVRKKVKVAAIQCYSRMGEKAYNFELISTLVREASAKGAKIIVLPEAALSGYMNPAKDITWTSKKASAEELSVQSVAETIEGEFVKKYLELAANLKVYLTIPFIEESEGEFYNSVLLASPQGEILSHHRKESLWTHGDSGWCSVGNSSASVVDTEYGKLGLMICYDVHSMPEKLAALKADIVLYSVGWYGPNTEDWYKRRFPEKYVIPNNFSVVAANWSSEKGESSWVGAGWSNVVYRNGIVLKITDKIEGKAIVIAEIPLK